MGCQSILIWQVALVNHLIFEDEVDLSNFFVLNFELYVSNVQKIIEVTEDDDSLIITPELPRVSLSRNF